MSEPFLGEIRVFGFNFAPRGHALCDGQPLPINQNQSLFSLLGTIYGGDGRTEFNLPDLRGRMPIHFDTAHRLGEAAGTEQVTLTQNQIPSHGHLRGSGDQATANTPAGGVTASRPRRGNPIYTSSGADVVQAGDRPAGGGQGHSNLQPYTVINFAIALTGVFPSRN